MSLTRGQFGRISYLLEVAPIRGSSVNIPCRESLQTQQRFKRWVEGRKQFQTGIPRYKKPTKVNKSPKGHASAASTLLLDNEAGRAAPTRPEGTIASTAVALDRLTQILTDAKQPLQGDGVVSEKDALKSLKLCRDLAKVFKDSGTGDVKVNDSPAARLLFTGTEGENDATVSKDRIEQAAAIRGTAIKNIAATAQAVVTDPKVFITPQILDAYVQLRISIGYIDDLARTFELYATKLIPELNTQPIKYSTPAQHKAAFAVPLETAQLALDAAILTRNFPLCLEIIQNTVARQAFLRHKIIQQALIPLAGVAAAPFAAYALASQFAVFQENLDFGTARWVGFAGVMSYIGFTGTIGYVALTTANDQMERVVWQDGTPLRERWLREQERNMLDQVAVAWGFKDPNRKGEEEGPEWEALRELISLRGMILDKVELMEGMQ